MENASKALLMAAGVLIGILILSLAVYLFVTFGTSSAQMHSKIETDRLNEFNTQFTSYEGKDDITIYDVITVANIATDNNKYYELSKRTDNTSKGDYYLKVLLETRPIEYGKEKNSKDIIADYNNIIKSNLNNGELDKYKCETEINESTGRVWKIIFTKI